VVMIQARPLSVLDKLLEPVSECLTRDVAERLVNARLDANMQTRLDELAAKANEGLLAPEERVEYEEYVEGLDLLAIFKAQARLALDRFAD